MRKTAQHDRPYPSIFLCDARTVAHGIRYTFTNGCIFQPSNASQCLHCIRRLRPPLAIPCLWKFLTDFQATPARSPLSFMLPPPHLSTFLFHTWSCILLLGFFPSRILVPNFMMDIPSSSLGSDLSDHVKASGSALWHMEKPTVCRHFRCRCGISTRGSRQCE